MDRMYFVEHAEGVSLRRKRDITEKIRMHDDVAELIEDYSRVRKKRDYMEDNFLVYGPIEKRQANFAYKEPLPIPQLPFPDPLYEKQWYLVIFLKKFLFDKLKKNTKNIFFIDRWICWWV